MLREIALQSCRGGDRGRPLKCVPQTSTKASTNRRLLENSRVFTAELQSERQSQRRTSAGCECRRIQGRTRTLPMSRNQTSTTWRLAIPHSRGHVWHFQSPKIKEGRERHCGLSRRAILEEEEQRADAADVRRGRCSPVPCRAGI